MDTVKKLKTYDEFLICLQFFKTINKKTIKVHKFCKAAGIRRVGKEYKDFVEYTSATDRFPLAYRMNYYIGDP